MFACGTGFRGLVNSTYDENCFGICVSIGVLFIRFGECPAGEYRIEKCLVAGNLRTGEKTDRKSFMYSNDDIRHLQKRDFRMTDADVETIMEACLKDTGLTFEVVDEVVIVKPAVQVMNSVPQKKMVLSGTVKDNRGDVMPGVTVRIKGTTLGVATDIDGKWNLEIPEMNDVVLVFSFVGMESQEIEPGNRTVIDVVMEVAKENLEEVVVTGIFKRNKEGFTGSATQVSGDEIKKMTAGNVLKALEMLDPGFRMNTSNLPARIRMRSLISRCGDRPV